VLKAALPTPVRPTSIGALTRFHGLSLAGAGPGDYELVLRVRDEITGRTVESREPFEIGDLSAERAPAAASSGPR